MKYPFRCASDKPHGPHHVPGCDECGLTAFDCPGRLIPADFERLLTEAFGPE